MHSNISALLACNIYSPSLQRQKHLYLAFVHVISVVNCSYFALSDASHIFLGLCQTVMQIERLHWPRSFSDSS